MHKLQDLNQRNRRFYRPVDFATLLEYEKVAYPRDAARGENVFIKYSNCSIFEIQSKTFWLIYTWKLGNAF